MNDKKFNIILHDNTRTYHFSNSQLGTDLWMKALTDLIIAQKSYVRTSLLPGKSLLPSKKSDSET